MSQLGDQLTRAYHGQQIGLGRALLLQVLRIWPLWDLDDLDGTWPGVMAGLMALVEGGHQLTAQQAGAFYSALRLVEGQPGTVTPVLAEFDRPKAEANLMLLGPIMTKKAIGLGQTNPKDVALVRVMGGVQRLSLGGGRQTLTDTMARDTRSRGYRRAIAGEGCDFCRGLAAQGTVKATEAFKAHSHCGCIAAPVFA